MIKILRKAEITENCVILGYYLFEEKTLRLAELTNKFSCLTEEEIRRIFRKKVGKINKGYNINTIYLLEDLVGGMLGTCLIEVTVKKDKGLVKWAHKEIMKRIRGALKECSQQNEANLLGDWLWQEKIFD